MDCKESTMSTSFKRQVMPVFTPSAVSGEHLESITVGRDAELTAIENAFRSAATSLNRPNVLLVGPRGSGKSHLISLMMHRASSSDLLSSKLAIVWLPEDVYTITTYTDLLRTMIRSLGGEAFPNSSDAGLEDTLRIVAGDQVIVLVAENFDRTLNLIGLSGQRALRAFQHNSGAFMMLASMPAIDEKLLDYDAPFYGAFQIIHLEDLTVDQGRTLLIKTAQRNGDTELVTFLESPTGLARLRAIEYLSGGSPRLWLIISGLMTVELLDELVPLFVKMLDELTPYYKARMDELAPAKAKVLAVLCRLGREPDGSGPMSVKDIAAECAMSQQTVSKQLHELENARFVRKVKNDKDKRATYYEPREPLLKHCLELKSNKGEPLTLIVSFLAAWYSLPELFLGIGKSESPYGGGAILERLKSVETSQLVSEIARLPAEEFCRMFPVVLIRSAGQPTELADGVSSSKLFDTFEPNKRLFVAVSLLVAYQRDDLRQAVKELLVHFADRSPEWRSITGGIFVFYSSFKMKIPVDNFLLKLRKISLNANFFSYVNEFPGARQLLPLFEQLLESADEIAQLLGN
jgi:DNA-binding MarR family transcriptional regulator